MCDYVNTEKGSVSTVQDNSSLTIHLVWVYNSNFAHDFYLCTLKIQYLAVIQLSMFRLYAA